ncbi:hypothetical protein JCM24511_09343 [Saitozyma sp. JCM 24511]|nr:hypothetical protein JCM24511_09343 [Saitozyma sp. JCM 24511]
MTSQRAQDKNHAATAGDKRKRVEDRPANPKEEPKPAKDVPAGRGEIDLPEGTAGKPPPKDAGKRSSVSGDEPILRYPQSRLTPFQNLVAACLLSKPICHKLGLRTIQTLLNPPFGLRTLDDLDEAGYEGRRKVM